MVVSWLIGAVYSALVVSLSSNNAFNVFNSADDLIQWTVSKEDYGLAIFNLILVTIAFMIGAFSYVSIFIYVYKASSKKGALLSYTMFKNVHFQVTRVLN